MLRTRVTFSSALGGNKVSTMHWTVGDTQTVADAASTALQTFWNSMDGEMVGTTTAIDTEVDIVDPSTGLQTGTLSVAPWSLTSGGSGDPLPPAVQGLVRWRTGQYINGKEVRGRTFIPNVPEVDNSGGRWLSSVATTVQGHINTLVAESAANLAIYSKVNRVAYPVTGGSLWTDFAILRSRRD